MSKKTVSRNEENAKCTVNRIHGPKTFSDFVDKVIQQIPVPAKTRTKIAIKESNDPLLVLRNRGLINIDNSPKCLNSPSSEVDLTFYTEESRLGEMVKLFSSTHRFQDGRLVYSTTIEAAPEVSSEVTRFNEWWQSQQKHGKLENNRGDSDNLEESKDKSTRKKLVEMYEDLKKDETIEKYESASEKMQRLYKTITPTPPISDVKENKSEKQKGRVVTSPRKTRSEEDYKIHNRFGLETNCRKKKNHNFLQSSPSDKAMYHAVWSHTSPRKLPNKNDTHFKESAKSSQCLFLSRSPIKQMNQYSKPSSRVSNRSPHNKTNLDKTCQKSSNRKPPFLQMNCIRSMTKERCTERVSPTRFEPLNAGKTRKESRSCYPRMENSKYNHHQFECKEQCNHGGTSDLFCSHRTPLCPLVANADFDCNCCQGDSKYNRITSDSSTSICTVFHNNDAVNSLANDVNRKEYNHSYKKGCDCEECMHLEISRFLQTESRKRSTREPSPRKRNSPQKYEQMEDITRKSRQQNGFHPKTSNLHCFARCHNRNHDHHEVVVTEGSVTTLARRRGPRTDELEAIQAIDHLINKEALKEFGKKYGDSICKNKNSKMADSFAREHFRREITKCCLGGDIRRNGRY